MRFERSVLLDVSVLGEGVLFGIFGSGVKPRAGQEENIEIRLPSGPLNFSFHLPPLKYYLPSGSTTRLISYSTACPWYCQ